jgi:autoinducer 2-degrading protein
MITRIVKMQFQPEKEDQFLGIIHQNADKIRSFEGCLEMRLFKVKSSAVLYMTISRWENEEFLEKYRNSDLFRSTWSATKALFSGSPEAWTLEHQY